MNITKRLIQLRHRRHQHDHCAQLQALVTKLEAQVTRLEAENAALRTPAHITLTAT